jgi:hypothetical protein
METLLHPQARRPAPSGTSLSLWMLTSLTLFGCSDLTTEAPLQPREPAHRQVASATENTVLQWNRTLVEAVRNSTLGPPMTARALAIVHTAIYDAWAAYDDVAVGTRLGGSLRRPVAERTLEKKSEALSYAAYRALVDLYPQQRALFDTRMRELGYDPANYTTDTSTPAGIGNVAAAVLLDYRRSDGSNQENGYADPTGYVPVNTWNQVNNPNYWQPLRLPNGTGGFVIQECLAPHWGEVTPFALQSGSELRPPPPTRYPHGLYRAQAEEVIHMSADLGDREKAIVEYWADGPRSELPPGHWNLFAQFVSQRDRQTLDQDVKLFFALNNAVMDAGIAAWEAKRYYDYVRPITAIRYLNAGKKIRAWAGPYLGTRVIDGERWLPYQPETFLTPPFAEYVSGHSTFSAASAEVLRLFTGSDAFGLSVTIRAGTSKIEPGAVPARDVVLGWSTFTEAAEEAGLSRLLGGIHFRDANVQGRTMGRAIGGMVWTKALGYFNGTMP